MNGLLIYLALSVMSDPQPWERAGTPKEWQRLRLLDPTLKEAGQTVAIDSSSWGVIPPITFRVGLKSLGKATDEDIKSLSRHPGVFELSLQGAAITDDAIASLSVLPGLEKLDLTGTSITDKVLAKLPLLAWLNYSYSNLSPISLADFRKLRPDVELYEGE